jgi:hypothetical protein
MSTPQNRSENRPVHTVRHGRIKATVWVNQTQRGPMHNVTLSRSYQDEEGNWHDTQSFGFDELMTVAKAVFDAHTFISNERAKAVGSNEQRKGGTGKKTPARQPAAV